MAKRSIALQPLSRQHHNGLFFCLLLEKGVKKKADPVLMRDFCMFFWENDLQLHFELEETNLVSLDSNAVLASGINRMMAEHARIRYLFHQNVQQADEQVFIQLYDLVEKHIRFEERELFPLIESVISGEELDEIGKAFVGQTDKNCSAYPIKFWE